MKRIQYHLLHVTLPWVGCWLAGLFISWLVFKPLIESLAASMLK